MDPALNKICVNLSNLWLTSPHYTDIQPYNYIEFVLHSMQYSSS